MKKRPELSDKNPLKRMPSDEFRKSGFLIFINSILHVFGVVIVYDPKDDIFYPAYTKYRGFPEEKENQMYKGLSHYMAENASDLLKDLDD